MANAKNDEDIRELLKHDEAEKVIKIVEKNPEKFDKLLKLLKDKNPIVRRNTVYCLRELKDQRAVGSLIDTLNDTDSVVRHLWKTYFQVEFADGAVKSYRMCSLWLNVLNAAIKLS